MSYSEESSLWSQTINNIDIQCIQSTLSRLTKTYEFCKTMDVNEDELLQMEQDIAEVQKLLI